MTSVKPAIVADPVHTCLRVLSAFGEHPSEQQAAQVLRAPRELLRRSKAKRDRRALLSTDMHPANRRWNTISPFFASPNSQLLIDSFGGRLFGLIFFSGCLVSRSHTAPLRSSKTAKLAHTNRHTTSCLRKTQTRPTLRLTDRKADCCNKIA